MEIVEEARRRSNKNDRLVTKFRPLISIIKTAGTLAKNKNLQEVTREEILEAIEVHCKSIQKQILENQMQEQGRFLEIEPTGSKSGTIYGLAVVSDGGEFTGSVLRVNAQLCKKEGSRKNMPGFFKVTGIAKNAHWIGDSAEKVRSVLIQKYG